VKPWRIALLALALPLLAGCGTLNRATEDKTQLYGEIPTGLGRYLEVRVAGVEDEELRAELLGAIRREFVRGGLFEGVRILEGEQPGSAVASELRVSLEGRWHEQIFDLFEWTDAYVERYELAIELVDEKDDPVLAGHITGIGIDAVSDPDYVDRPKQEDVRLAALHDASMKMSRALRQAAGARVSKVLESMPQVKLSRPLGLAALGFDDEESARQRQGPILLHHLRRAFKKLHERSFLLVSPEEIDLALEREELEDFADVEAYKLERVASHLPLASLLIYGNVEVVEGGVRATAVMVDRSGSEVVREEASAQGLGAVAVVAIKLARGLGKKLQELEKAN